MDRERSKPGGRLRRLVASVLGLALLGVAPPPLHAQSVASAPRGLRQKRAIATTGFGIQRPARLAFALQAERLIVLDAVDVGGTPPSSGVAGLLNLYGDPAGTIQLPGTLARAQAVTWDGHRQRFLALDVGARALHVVPRDSTGGLDVGRAARLEAPGMGMIVTSGMTVDPETGDLFVLDRGTRRILHVSLPGPEAGPNAEVPEGQWIALGPIAPLDLRGLAFDPASRHLFTLEASVRTLHELATDGRLVASHPITAETLVDPRSIVLAPSGDLTDDPETTSLYVADPGEPNGRHGHVAELAWIMEVAVPEAPVTGSAALVRVTPTSAYSPPSPDPSGICYDPDAQRLVISDAEVEEMSIWAGRNVFEAALTGVLQRSYSVTSFTLEPTGTAYDRNTRGIYFTDDDADEVFVVRPGLDGLVGTSDDARTSFSTRDFGATDPEGVAFDPVEKRLFIADGMNSEIYVLRPGANGVIDGAPPSGDDQVTHFDTVVLGANDTETVEYMESTGHLLVLARTGPRMVKAVTTNGTLVAQTDISFAPLDNPAGMAIAPTSNNPARRSLYIVNRGEDNDFNPSENDGTLVEVEFTFNGAPAVNAGTDQAITLPADALLDGTVNDDGNPDPPGAVVTWWTVVSGPGSVTFEDAASVDTRASFTTEGAYVLRLTADDGELTASDMVRIAVDPPGVVNRRVAAGADDAEEDSTGSMYLNSSDLEMVRDQRDQKVGLRFLNVSVDRAATITTAYVQFTAKDTGGVATSLVFHGHAADDAGPFTSTNGNVSSRPRTAAEATWLPPAWMLEDEAGPGQRTPELKDVIREIVARPGWASGNAIVLLVTGTGRRTALAYEGDASLAPLLHLEFARASEVGVRPPRETRRDELALHGVGSHPARGELRVEFSIGPGPASIELMDLGGRLVRRHDVGARGPGRHELEAGTGLRPGVYFVRLRQGRGTRVMKAAVLK